ncbi:INO80 complex subunit B-like [Argiope bruennichi]|uniref:INO80 complex subunit B-like n=1 Tax=Argiope bruennichi TaxID=94029 RepID=UPI002494882B|nr:INO80 complex subunit B-like [Argiope bruennichi]
MPKRKEPLTEDESVDVLGLPHKKHKKHKHKKHKKKRGIDDADDGSGGNSPGTPGEKFKPGLKLKIKIGGQTFGEARLSKSEINEASSDESANIDVVGASPAAPLLDSSANASNSSKKGKKMDEEEAWLAALEAGRLEEVDDELRRMKDPNLMTARQRSLLESKAQKEKEELTPVVAETVVLSEEMIQKKIIKAKKRKEQAEEKLQKDKKQTLERLLKKSDAKPRTVKKVVKKADVPRMRYINSEIKGCSLSIPQGFNFPLKPQVAKQSPAPILCGIQGCGNRKKYSCSKTGVPLCSLSCYKKNLLYTTTNQPITVT